MDRKSRIASALAAGLKLLRTVDAVSDVELQALRDEGAIDGATYSKLAARTDASDFKSLVSFVRERLPDATDEEIVDTLVAMADLEAQGNRSPTSSASG
jgi:hypothetical protein